MEEEKTKFTTGKNVFYNPAMQFCRSMSSLAVGAIGTDLEVVDAFCASGIRGIRYAKENPNVLGTTFIDVEPKAVAVAKKNAKSNKLKFTAVRGSVSRLAFEYDADFLEIDPFGTPSPYLVDAFRFFNTKKSAYLSATATDVAVLCGGKTAACMKNYHSKPLNNEFTHETGLRILFKKIVETAAEFNMGVTPLISFSNKHYLKIIVSLKRGADLAYECMRNIGYVSFCPRCGFRAAGRFPQPCEECSVSGAKTGVDISVNGSVDFAGPLWLGDLHNASFIRKMISLNQTRVYSEKEAIGKMLRLMAGEIGMPPYYYNVHELCKLAQTRSVPSLDSVITALNNAGYNASRTHFSPICIKTDALFGKIREVVRS